MTPVAKLLYVQVQTAPRAGINLEARLGVQLTLVRTKTISRLLVLIIWSLLWVF